MQQAAVGCLPQPVEGVLGGGGRERKIVNVAIPTRLPFSVVFSVAVSVSCFCFSSRRSLE